MKLNSLWDCLGHLLCILCCIFRRDRVGVLSVFVVATKSKLSFSLKGAQGVWHLVQGNCLGIFIVCPGWLFTGMPVTAGDVSWAQNSSLKTRTSGYKEQRVAGSWWLISRGAEPWMLLPSSGEKHSGCFLYHSQLTSNARGNGHLRSSQTQSQAKGFFFCFPFPHRKQLTLCDFSLSAVNLLRTQSFLHFRTSVRWPWQLCGGCSITQVKTV